MEVKELKTWAAFEQQIQADYDVVKEKHENKTHYMVFDHLYRGHPSSSWNLDTTLERYSNALEYSWSKYHQVLRSILTGVNSLSPNKFELGDFQVNGCLPVPPGYEMMIYVRHHGFPSPLLDWTKSPYVAAFFAFFDAKNSDEVAIFSCFKDQDNLSTVCLSEPHIEILGPYVETHKRHYQQQSWYTVCYKDNDDNKRIYCNHELAKGNTGNTKLTKYLLPSNLRSEFLHKLDLMNINSFSLFGSEDKLMETLAYREIEKRN